MQVSEVNTWRSTGSRSAGTVLITVAVTFHYYLLPRNHVYEGRKLCYSLQEYILINHGIDREMYGANMLNSL